MSGMPINELFVLIVEPSTTQRKIIITALNNLGVESILETESGENALDILTAKQPDLVLSSLYLPDMTGTDLVHTIRHLKENSDTAFMLISSETRFRYLDPIRQAGAVGILPKPFEEHELMVALKATVSLIEPSKDISDKIDPESLKVLVVDDSALARKYICRVLSSMGIKTITTANDGVEALDLVNANYYDFVVTDYNMPNMDGQELVDKIRTTSSQAAIPILMVTSEDNENRLAAVTNSGVSAICDKPFEPSTVRDIVSQFIH